ncbi:MAG: hypothetical protein SF339_21455 [Blastocatellia bacterium]|nr:hypothetical protein [Blastocatellia bacterium]
MEYALVASVLRRQHYAEKIEKISFASKTRDQIINKWGDGRKQAGRRGSPAQHQAGFEDFTGANAFVADLGIHAGKDAQALWIVAIVQVEAALSDVPAVVAKEFFVPGLFDFGGAEAHFAIVVKKLDADIDAFVTDIARVALEESRDFAFAQAAERAPQDGAGRLLGDEAPIRVGMGGFVRVAVIHRSA